MSLKCDSSNDNPFIISSQWLINRIALLINCNRFTSALTAIAVESRLRLHTGVDTCKDFTVKTYRSESAAYEDDE